MEEKYTQMVEDCRRHDREAMRRLYEATAPMAMGVCMRYCRNRDTAQDVMQDGYVKVYEGLSRLRDPERVMAWVYQVMVNECINHNKALEKTVSLDDMNEEPSVLPMDPFADEEVVEALQQLTSQQRTVFNLLEVEGLTEVEAAQQMNTTVANVRTHFSRACKMLRTILLKEK